MTNRKDPRFVGLHGHSGFSIGDGFGKPEEHIDFALQNGMDALALTDHGHMNGFPHQYLHAKKLGSAFKPVYGFEGYFHPSLEQWEADREDAKLRKAHIVDDEKVALEDEEESKKAKWFNPVNRRHHLVTLAKSAKGLKNVFTLVSRGYKEGMYRFPRFDFNMLKEHGEDVIVTSACLGGPFSYEVLKGFHDDLSPEQIQLELANLADRFVDAVGQENFYLEVQFNDIPIQHQVNEQLLRASIDFGIPLVATADSHYPSPDKWRAREVYKRISWMGKKEHTLDDLPDDIDDMQYQLYPKNGEEMWRYWEKYRDAHPEYYEQFEHNDLNKRIWDAIDITHDIAHQQIGAVSPDTATKIFTYATPTKTSQQILREKCEQALRESPHTGKNKYWDRLEVELGVIGDRDFADYFLCYERIAIRLKERMLMGPGRGSGAGSLVCYLLDITELDPIQYGLLFERFISRFRKGFPDIDSDVASKELAVEILRDEFGDDNVITISNYNRLQLKSLIKDVSKFFDIPYQEVNAVTKRVEPEVKAKVLKKGMDKNLFYLTYDLAFEHSPTFQKYVCDYPEAAAHIRDLFQQLKAISRHAGGVLIYDQLEGTMPVIKIRGECQAPWTEGLHYKHLPELGFIKFDVLGLETLRVIELAIRNVLISQGNPNPTFAEVRTFYDKNLRADVIDDADMKVLKNVYWQGKFPAIFQFTEDGAQKLIKRIRPEMVLDIATGTSIYRPGPLAAEIGPKKLGVDKVYINRRRGEAFTYDHPAIEKVLSPTNGVIIFQEQMMQLAHELAGMDLNDCDRLRKAIVKRSMDGKGKAEQERRALNLQFVEGCVNAGLDVLKAQKLWDDMELFAGYGFNKSHALAYAFDSYICAWLFTYYPNEWMAAFLETYSEKGDKKKARAFSTAKSFGYEVVLPDINQAGWGWTAIEDEVGVKLMSSFSPVKRVGDKAVEEIMANRPFRAIDEVFWRDDNTFWPSKMNKGCVDALIKIKAFDSLSIIGEGKLFDNYAHMHAVIVGHWDEIKKRLLKRSPERNGHARFYELIEEYRGKVEPWTREEQIEFYETVYGSVNIDLILNDELVEKLSALGVDGIHDYHEIPEGYEGEIEDLVSESKVVWFIIREVNIRTTKRGKPFAKLRVMGSDGNLHWMTYWGYNAKYDTAKLTKNAVVAARLKYDDNWGFSTPWGGRLSRLDTLVD